MWKALIVVGAIFSVCALLFLSALLGGQASYNQAVAAFDCTTTPGILPGVVPQPYNSIFTAASVKAKIDPALLAAVFMSEHSNTWPNSHGPWATSPMGANGPFQFLVGPGSAWDAYSDSNPNHPQGDVQNLTDSAYAAAHYLADEGGHVNMPAGDPNSPIKGTVSWAAGAYNGGAPITDPSSIGYRENHNYRVNAVAKYLEFKGDSPSAGSNVSQATPVETEQIPNDTCAPLPDSPGSVSALELTRNPKITFTHPGPELNDLTSGRVSPRLIALLANITTKHTIGIFALASDHHPGTNHESGRAVDIWMVDGDNCYPPRMAGACWKLAQELDRLLGCLHPTELIYFYDPGPSPDSFARDDHDDHIHVGYDGPLGPKHYTDGIDPCSAKALTGSG
jgi:hypothetical protein